MASANNGQALTTAVSTLYDPSTDGAARGIVITNRSASSGNVLVNAEVLHKSSAEFAGVSPGTTTPFICSMDNQKLGKVRVKTDSSTATIDWTLVR